MERIPSSPPPIAPVPKAEENRPLFSVMIPAFNCATYLGETIASVVVQDMGEAFMQIEVVDDCSTDADVEELVQRVGKGRVKYFRQSQNVGSLRNFETCINRANGIYVHLLHGDDKVKPGFYAKMKSLFERFPTAGAAFCQYAFINQSSEETHLPEQEANSDGILRNWLLRIAERQRTQYVATIVKREVYEKLGSFYGMTYGEDWEMWVRIAKYYPVAYTPEVLAQYREHKASISKTKSAQGKITQDFLTGIHLIRELLPNEHRDRVIRIAKKNCALFNMGTAFRIWDNTRDRSLVLMQVKQAFALSKQPAVCYSALKLFVKMALFFSRPKPGQSGTRMPIAEHQKQLIK